jgi:hypothetical protein
LRERRDRVLDTSRVETNRQIPVGRQGRSMASRFSKR